MQPIRRFGFDAAILFSDILVVPHALGQRWALSKAKAAADPLKDPAALQALRAEVDHECLRRSMRRSAGAGRICRRP